MLTSVITGCFSDWGMSGPSANSYKPAVAAITSDRPIELYTVDLATALTPTFTSATVSSSSVSPTDSSQTPAFSDTPIPDGGSTPSDPGGTTPASALSVYDAVSAFTAAISVTASAPSGANTVCSVQSPFSGVSCLLAGFNFSSTDIGTSGNLAVKVRATNGRPQDYLVSNNLSVKKYKIEAVMKSTTGSYVTETDSLPEIAKIGNKVFFIARNSGSFQKLFVFDEDADTVTQMPNIVNDTANDYTYKLKVFNSKVYFSASTSGLNYKLFASDGSSVNQITNNNAGGVDLSFNTEIIYPTVFGNHYFAPISRTLSYKKLYTLDSSENLVQIGDTANSATISDNPRYLTEFNGALYFTSLTAPGIIKLFKTTDGVNITQVSDIRGVGVNDGVRNLVATSNALYFWALNASGVQKLFKYDGSTFTQMSNTRGNQTQTDLYSLIPYGVAVGTDFYFWANNTSGFTKLYKTDGTTVTQVSDLMMGSFDSADARMKVLNNEVYFRARYNSYYRLFKTDGTTITQISDFQSAADDMIYMLGTFDGALYFVGRNSSGYDKLFKTDGSNVQQVMDLNANAHDFDLYAGACSMVYPTFYADADEAFFSAFSNIATCEETLFRLRKQ